MGTWYRFVSLVFALSLPAAAVAETGMPAWLIRLPESVPSAFVAETAESTFHRYERVDGNIELAASFYMSVGKKGWGKERVGDQRTPIGTYIVTEQLDTERLHEKYGITAYVLDYPNAWDRRLLRTGDGIWVHGVDRRGGRRPPLDTDGCIALPNEDLEKLAGQFEDGVTPVIIAERIDRVSQADLDALGDELAAAIATWAQSIADGDMHTYLSYYHEDFERWGMGRDEWASFRLQTLGTTPIEDVAVRDLLLLGYPGETDLYLSRFQKVVTEDEAVKETVQRIYWRRDAHGALKIVAEDNG
ncbi:MAG: L,D-transpeptidase family protein [Pseudomonadota bacterium]